MCAVCAHEIAILWWKKPDLREDFSIAKVQRAREHVAQANTQTRVPSRRLCLYLAQNMKPLKSFMLRSDIKTTF
jgi:hypothetical protein